MRQHSASTGTVIQGKFLHGRPVIQAQSIPVPAPKPPVPPPPVAQPKIRTTPPFPNATENVGGVHQTGAIQQKQLTPGMLAQPQAAQPAIVPHVPTIQAGVKPAPPPLKQVHTHQPPVQPKQLIPHDAVQPQFAQPAVVPHVPKIQAGAKPAPPPLRPIRQSTAAQPKLSAQPRGNSGLTVQRTANGNAFQLPAHLCNFGNFPGKPLPEAIQRKMESFFKTDFSDVRVHIGPQAAAIGALAFTQGSHLYFAPGQFNPQSTTGQQLLGHELTHVVQQRAGRVRNPFGSLIAVVHDTVMEGEADRLGRQAGRASTPQPLSFRRGSSPEHSHKSLAQRKPDSRHPLTPLAVHGCVNHKRALQEYCDHEFVSQTMSNDNYRVWQNTTQCKQGMHGAAFVGNKVVVTRFRDEATIQRSIFGTIGSHIKKHWRAYLVIGEGVLTLGASVAAMSLSGGFGAIPAFLGALVGASKIARGVLMIFEQGNDNPTWRTVVIDGLRVMEAALAIGAGAVAGNPFVWIFGIAKAVRSIATAIADGMGEHTNHPSIRKALKCLAALAHWAEVIALGFTAGGKLEAAADTADVVGGITVGVVAGSKAVRTIDAASKLDLKLPARLALAMPRPAPYPI